MVVCFVGVKMMRPILWIAAAPITVVGIPCPAIIIVASAVRGPLNFPNPGRADLYKPGRMGLYNPGRPLL